ncbi:AI-2E family transporter [uncultured Sphingomonas sp.]|uniref:AI-2E family transporter n=1 Tax=uncultured Sphingomonas sp. TaxID=158754 RepID=UPI0035C9FB05
MPAPAPSDPTDRPPPPARARLAPDADDARFIRRVLILVLILAVIAALVRAGDLLILAFGSMLGAIVIHAVAEIGRERLRLPARAALPAAILFVLGVIAFLIWLFGVQFRPQVNLLVTRLPDLLTQLNAWLARSPVGAKIADASRAAFAGSRVARDIGGLAQGAGEMVLNAIILLVGALFFAADPKVYERGFLLLVPPRHRAVFEDALFDAGATLRLWLRAELIQMTSMGLLVGTGLWLAGVPSSAALALLTGLSEFVPYVGPIAAMLPALGLAATVGTHQIVGVLVTAAVARLIQTNFVTPFVTSRVVAIPPAMTVFSIIGIGYIFGVFGLFFSAALLVVIYTLVRSLYLREVLGEPIPRAAHQRLLWPNPIADSHRDSPETLD